VKPLLWRHFLRPHDAHGRFNGAGVVVDGRRALVLGIERGDGDWLTVLLTFGPLVLK
jgi:hypothetical protein